MYDTKIRTDGSLDPFAGDGERALVVTVLLIAHTLALPYTGCSKIHQRNLEARWTRGKLWKILLSQTKSSTDSSLDL